MAKQTDKSKFAQGSHQNQGGFSPDEFQEKLEDAYASGNTEAVLDLIESAPKWLQNEPEFMTIKASALIELGEENQAQQLLLEALRKNPHLTDAYVPLSFIYFDKGCQAHAADAARRALDDPELPEDAQAALGDILTEAEDAQRRLALKLGVSMQVMHQAALAHENALMAISDEKYTDVEYFAQKALKLIPAWDAPQNNRAHALYFSGKCSDAIKVLDSVLSYDAENVFALYCKVLFHWGLDQSDQVQSSASRLKALIPGIYKNQMDTIHLILALALLEDTPTLWMIAQKFRSYSAEDMIERAWHCLAVAAVRSGKWKAAQDLINKIGTDESDPDEESFSTQIAGARRRHPPRLDWMPPAYPGPDIFLDYKRIDHLGNLLGGDSETLSPSRRRKVDSYLNQYPFMKVALKRLLWDERGCLLSRSMLIRINQPELDDEILRFAFSQVGTREARMQAVLELAQSGRFKETKVSLWDENQNQWHAVAISGQRIGDAPIRAQARTLDLIEKAHRAKTPQEAIVWLRKAVALEPTCGIALFNLGVTLTQNGNEVEGKALIYQSVDVDPEYTYGHASIALTEADNHQEKAALDHLEFVTHASVITHDTAVIANLAWCVLAAQRLDFDLARKHLDLAVQINPDHKLITYYETFLSDQKWLATEKDYLRESAEFTHRKLLRTHLTPTLDLQSCLESHTKDMLLGSAHFLRTASTGKKAELVYRLMCRLLNAEFLKTTLDEDLEQAEQEALRWLMAAGGVCPWAEFIEKFGDDMYESADWIYREPQSILGHLRMSGLVFSGTLEGQQVAFIPPDLRRVLENVLK